MKIFLVIEKCWQHNEVIYDDEFTAFDSEPLARAFVEKQEVMTALVDRLSDDGSVRTYEILAVPYVTLPVGVTLNA